MLLEGQNAKVSAWRFYFGLVTQEASRFEGALAWAWLNVKPSDCAHCQGVCGKELSAISKAGLKSNNF